jgi:uncharacterized protein (TIGR00255 family)
MKPSSGPITVLSMTGYAQARAEHEGWVLRVSLRSVNHRFLDLRVRIPEGFEALEPRVRQMVRENLRRGHVDVTLHVDAVRSSGVQINREAAAAYLGEIEALRRDFGFVDEPDVVALLRLPGVVAQNGAAAPMEEEMADLDAPLVACLKEALDKLYDMRREEGRSLAAEMRRLLTSIAEKTEQAEALTESSRPAYAQRLKTRLEELLGGVALEPARLAQEAALLAERADVTEELARLRSHIDQFAKAVDAGGEIGKKLDFLLQEMQREANTFLSKTPGLGEDGLAMTSLGLQIKSEIEKLREQAQNVE